MAEPADELALDDARIAANVRETLQWDPRLDASTIRVEVLDGIVTLAGSVRLLAESAIAAEDAWRVKGVRQVINDIAVNPTAVRTDADILADVLNALRYDPRVDEHAVILQVVGGVVTLAGTVGSSAEVHAAEEDAWFTPGVIAVTNTLTVAPDRRRPDSDITADVREALTRDARITDPTRIGVEVRNGTVTLSGGVDRPEERRAAEEDAWFTAGVQEVINHLVISPLTSTV